MKSKHRLIKRPPPTPAAESRERRRKRLEREAACKAFDAMVAARPRTPPPGRPALRVATAAEIALRNDQRIGLVGGGVKFLDEIEE